MDLARLAAELTRAAQSLGIAVRSDARAAALRGASGTRGGLCKVRGRPVIVLDASAPLPDQIAILAAALARFDLDTLTLEPIVRATIGVHRKSGSGSTATSPQPLARARKRDKDPS
jgi:hypothetical protein